MTGLEFFIIQSLLILVFILVLALGFYIRDVQEFLRENKITDEFSEFVLRKKYRRKLRKYELVRINDGKDK